MARELRWLVIDQEKGAILRCQKGVEADFRERLHDLFLPLKSLLAIVPFAVSFVALGRRRAAVKPPFFGAFMSGDGANALMTVAVAIECNCFATSRRLLLKCPSWLRFSRINDGVSKIFPPVCRPFRHAGRQHRSARNFVNCRNVGQLNYAWLFPSSALSLDIRLPCLKAT